MSEKPVVTKYRVCTWGRYNEHVDEVEFTYGIEARIGPRMWAHVAEGNEPLFFKTAEQAVAEVKRLNKELRAKEASEDETLANPR